MAINYKSICESVDISITSNLNAPEFAYYCLTGEIKPIRGRRFHPEKIVNGIVVDKEIPDEAIIELNSIPDIEVRATCQGDDFVPTFLIFRILTKMTDKEYSKKVADCINKKLKSGKCCIGLGRQGFIRICVTAARDELKGRFNLWWKELPEIIKSCIVQE